MPNEMDRVLAALQALEHDDPNKAFGYLHERLRELRDLGVSPSSSPVCSVCREPVQHLGQLCGLCLVHRYGSSFRRPDGTWEKGE